MTDREINVAIAEACWWTVMNYTLCEPKAVIKNAVYTGEVDINPVASLPDYCHDLNAMHEAEDVLASDSIRCAITDYELLIEKRSPARQRAEALLRTIGKWRD